jgi:4-hydroxy-2-oxoheptanedioate aldolase
LAAIGLFVRGIRPRSFVEVLDLLGLDFVVIDTEHETWNPEDLALLAGHARNAKTKVFFRVPTSSYADVFRPLDNGADGVVVPRVESATEAAAVVRAARHPPFGERGVSLRGRLRAKDAAQPLSTRLATVNQDVQVIIQIESRTAVEQADAIAGTAGVDGVLIGLTDLSCSVGHPDDPAHPDVSNLVGLVLAACQKHQRSFGVAAPGELATDWVRRGASLLLAGIDTELLIASVRERATELRAISLTAASERNVN